MIKIIHFNTQEEYKRWVDFPGNMQIVYEAHMVSYCDAHTNVQIVKSRLHRTGCVSMKRYTEMVQETIIGRILTTENEYENQVPTTIKQKCIELWEYTFKQIFPKSTSALAIKTANNTVDAFIDKFKNKGI